MTMELSTVRINGFKSFVDQTEIKVEKNLTAIVGPNGCGKSNIIDAITWVLGESSAKYLRGESSTDVIFNGTNTRKPVGQASVELVFDNSDGSLGGEYASYSEISIKRTITRDSDSTYYLNGAKCRKRDISDIFLGTGLGPRSYAIVGQNMISRIVESKPEELRTYLEEAAGISKYKERRRETELRIQHTKDNLARVNDLRLELDKQLGHLKHQANVAEKYKTLKEQERTLRAQVHAIQWRHLDCQMVDHTLKIQREETNLEARNAEISSTDREVEQLRHEQRVAQDAFQEVQRRYYAAGNEITRIEQDILHHEEREQQWRSDLAQAENDWQTIKDQMSESEDALREIDKDIVMLEPQLADIKHEVDELSQAFTRADNAVQDSQARWDDFNQTAAKTAQTAQVEKNRSLHIEQKIAYLKKRQDQLQQEQLRANYTDLSKEIEDYSKQSYEAADKLELHSKELQSLRNEIQTLQASLHDSDVHLDQVRVELQQLLGQQASLEALQQTALGKRDNPVSTWADKYNLSKYPRLAQHIDVESGWEFAVEKALGIGLQALCVDKLDEVIPYLNEFKSGNLCLVSAANSDASTATSEKGELLLSKVKSKWPLDALISGIYTAGSLDEALQRAPNLAAHESIITKDGAWVNRAWIKMLHEEDPSAGVFQREQELKQIASRIDHLQSSQKELERNIAQRKGELQALEQRRDQLQETYNQDQAKSAQIKAEQKMKQERLDEVKEQAERCLHELQECASQLKQAEEELQQSQALAATAQQALEEQATRRDVLLKERDTLKQTLHDARERLNEKKEQMHELEIRVQTSKSQQGSLNQTISRLHIQLSSLNERKITLQSELKSMAPLDNLKKSLERALDRHVSIESELNTARASMESLDQDYKNLEEKRQIVERDINKIRNSLESLRVEMQGWRVKVDTLTEQIKESDLKLEDVLKDLPENCVLDEFQANLDQTVQRINRLGAINLVAIEEFATCQERKQYLDQQFDDLQAGLATLEDAISKIDKETKQRFKETYDRVNSKFKEIFPSIFGGGKAYLELTSDDLLEAGVSVMACPPGKRNSTINLLSGGEKTLSAIALIFSIFHLNPAPFCLLDEVDAALDDANVIRFTHLVKSMAEKTQFIFISHNKIAIEMGECLIGVTMNEPGVSRLVSVDIEKAINLAGVE